MFNLLKIQIVIVITAISVLIKNLNVYVGFNCFIMFNNREIYGPFKPTLASGSDSSIPSCHAEVNAIKHILNIKGKKKLHKSTMFITRWTYDKANNNWTLQNGIPCYDCMLYIKKFNIKNFVISTNTSERFKKVSFEYIEKNTKKSTGRLYGK